MKHNYYFTSCGLLFLFGMLFYRNFWISILIMPLSVFLKKYYEQWSEAEKKWRLTVEFKDFLYSLSSSFSTGRNLQQSLREAIPVLRATYGETGILCKEIEFMVLSMEYSQSNEEELFFELTKRYQMKEIKQLSQMYGICRRTGGDIQRVVMKTAQSLLQNLSLKEEMRAACAQKILEFRIMASLPILMIFLLNVFSFSYIEPLYHGLEGRVIMTIALLGLVSSYLWSRSLIEVSFSK